MVRQEQNDLTRHPTYNGNYKDEISRRKRILKTVGPSRPGNWTPDGLRITLHQLL